MWNNAQAQKHDTGHVKRLKTGGFSEGLSRFLCFGDEVGFGTNTTVTKVYKIQKKTNGGGEWFPLGLVSYLYCTHGHTL